MEQTSVVPLKGTASVVSVIAGPSVHQVDYLIGLVIPIGILEKQHARLIDNKHTAVVELETRGAMEFVVKDFRDVRFAIPIGIFKDHKLIPGAWVAWFPLGISRHASKPSSTFVIEVQLHGLSNIWELGLIGKQLDLETLWNLGLRDELIGRQVAKRFGFGILLPWIAKSCLRDKQFAGIVIVGSRRYGFALSDVPAVLVAHLCHPSNLGVLQREGLFVPRAATTVNIPSVEHAIILQVHPALFVDSRAKLFKSILIESSGNIVERKFLWIDVEELLGDKLSDCRIASFIQMATVDRVLQCRLRTEHFERGIEQVDKGQLAILSNLLDG